MTDAQLLALVGPTASGKTEASVVVAGALGAEIVCVDSMLVYRGMDVGTAKPDAAQRAAVPHHLIDVAAPTESFSVARFQELARGAVHDIRTRGNRALLVGGGGLYYRAVVDGLAFPGTSPEIRALLQAEAAVLGPDPLYRRLAGLDPAAAGRIEPMNARRTVRALEVAAMTGRPFSEQYVAWDRFQPGGVRAAGVDLDRAALHRRIERRVEGMLPGLLAETRALLDRGAGPFLTSSQAIGYAEAVACLGGSMSEEEAAAVTVRRTKALARRQLAWLRRDPRIRWFPAGEDGAVGVADRIAAYLETTGVVQAGPSGTPEMVPAEG
jgi:tRNA dimethylallyltransferase